MQNGGRCPFLIAYNSCISATCVNDRATYVTKSFRIKIIYIKKMIRIIQNSEHITMYIKMNFSFTEICDFLAKKGYTVKSWLWRYEDETFLGGISYNESWTFTATKDGEEQSEENLYLTVFENEIKKLLKI